MVLIIEDNDDIRVAISRLLRLDGYKSEAVSSGEAAMEYLATHSPGCILLDLSLPGIDGFEVIRRVRADDRLRNARIIVQSAYDGELRDRALQLGADAFILKGTLDWLKIGRAVAEHCGPSTTGTTPPASPKLLDRDAG